MEEKKLLVFSDLCSYGRVALSVSIPLFSRLGISAFPMTTAVVSNTLDYGEFEVQDMTQYIRKSLEIYSHLGFSFDAIQTGFLTSYEQARMVYDYCKVKKEEGISLFVDPIMGDHGSLYPGIEEDRVECMKLLSSIADLIVPNLTEATYLTGKYIGKTDLTTEEITDLLEALSNLTKESIVITSAKVNGNPYVALKEKEEEGYRLLPYEEVDAAFPGTGDIFSTSLISSLLKGEPLEEGTRKAMDLVKELIQKTKGQKDVSLGIPLERYGEEIDHAKAED